MNITHPGSILVQYRMPHQTVGTVHPGSLLVQQHFAEDAGATVHAGCVSAAGCVSNANVCLMQAGD